MPAIDVSLNGNRATDLATFTVKVNGSQLPGTYSVVSIDVNKSINRIATAELVLLDGDPASQQFGASSDDLLVPGNEIEIEAGYSMEEEVIFKGIIVKQRIKVKRRGDSLLYVTCKDPAFRMALDRKSAYFKEITDSDLIDEIVGKYDGLQTDILPTTNVHAEVVQYQVTDWDFLLSRAEKTGLCCVTDSGTLSIKKPDLLTPPATSLTFGQNIFDFDLELDAQHQYKAVNAYAWNPTDQEMLAAEVDSTAEPPQGNIDGVELAGTSKVDQFDLRHSGKLEQQELDAWAEAQLQRARLSRIRGMVKFQGTADLKVGGTIELNGLGDRFNGQAFVAGLRHLIGDGDWTTAAEIGMNPDWHHEQYPVEAMPASGFEPPINGLQVGVVTQLQDDPDGENRIKVRLPVVNDQEDGSWMRLASLDAGEQRGFVFLPEIDDEVIVGFINDDPNDPVVLGMLHSSAKPSPLEASDDNHEKGLVTREQMKVIFNDDLKSIAIETPNGNQITISDDEGAISIVDENDNKITLNADGVSIESPSDINIKATGDLNLEGMNVNIKASSSLVAEGSSTADFKSSGSTSLKGSVVQIN